MSDEQQPGANGIPVDAWTFRAALGRLAGGVTIVSTIADGRDHAMTANAVTSVSLEPPLVLVCVETASRFHEAVLDAGVWGVSILGKSQRPAAQWLATPGRPLVGQLDQIPHTRGASGVVMITGSLATLECETYAVHPAGDHSIVLGRVTALTLADEPEAALVYYRSQFGSLA